eukprot:1416831-Prorocentrum_lima.AAC.1
MTSSLVGSEMCIRDRCNTDYTIEQAYFEACRHPMTGQLNPYFHGVHSVSYTHLTLPTICSV